MNKEILLAHGFHEADGMGERDRGHFIYCVRITNTGINLAVDLKNKRCVSFEGDRPSAFPNRIYAMIREEYRYPEDINDANRIYKMLTGYDLPNYYLMDDDRPASWYRDELGVLKNKNNFLEDIIDVQRRDIDEICVSVDVLRETTMALTKQVLSLWRALIALVVLVMLLFAIILYHTFIPTP